MKEEFGTLRSETVMQVFRTSLKKSSMTRSEIAHITNFSVVTAGKAADALVELGILCQHHTADASPGRPSRTLHPSRHKWIAVYDINQNEYCFYMLDLSLKIIDTFKYKPSGGIFTDDEIRSFAYRANIFASSRRKAEECIGCGILAPCDYNEENDRLVGGTGLTKIRPKYLLREYSFNKRPYIGNSRRYTSVRIRNTLCEGSVALALFIDRGDIKSAYISCEGEGILSAADLFSLPGGTTLGELSRDGADIKDFCTCLTELIMTSVCAFSTDTIVICGSMFESFDHFRSAVGDMVYTRCQKLGLIPPEIISCGMSGEAAVGISEEIRDKWFFDEMIDSY